MQFIPLLKGLGFLTADGSPTERYKQFLDITKWKKVLGEAVRESYSDIFVLKTRPSSSDRDMIAGKFKSTYNLSDTAAERAARTFLALLALSDPDTVFGDSKPDMTASFDPSPDPKYTAPQPATSTDRPASSQKSSIGLQYNIQIHLPATKDIEVYNAIFKSLREHVID